MRETHMERKVRKAKGVELIVRTLNVGKITGQSRELVDMMQKEW